MKIIFDTREPQLYSACMSMQNGISMSVTPLTLGDIVFRTETEEDLVIIERKSLSDLIASIKDGRYEEQSHRLIHTSGLHTHNIIYIIEGMYSQIRNLMDRNLVISAMTSLQLYKGFSVIRTACVQETAQLIVGMFKKIHKNSEKNMKFAFTLNSFLPPPPPSINIESSNNNDEIINTDTNTPTVVEEAAPSVVDVSPQPYVSVVKKVKKDNITPENIGEILLSQIPSISSITAIELMKRYKTIHQLINVITNNPAELDTICLTSSTGKTRKIGKNIVEQLKRFLVSGSDNI